MQTDDFGFYLLKCRKEKNLTQQELADRLFVSNSTIYKWEKGISKPNLETYDKLAEVLGISVDDLLYCARNNTSTVVKETDAMEDNDNCDANDNGVGIESFVGMAGESNVKVSKIKKLICSVFCAAVLLMGIVGAVSYLCEMKITIVDEYFEAKNESHSKDFYYVIVQYAGIFDKEKASEFVDNHRDSYEKHFESADRIAFLFVDTYEEGQKNMEVEYKVVLASSKKTGE